MAKARAVPLNATTPASTDQPCASTTAEIVVTVP
jgi:hypothetical protein